MVYLGTHYGKPMDWTEEKAEQAEATLRQWHGLVAGAEDRGLVDEAVVEALSDDLNTAGAIARLHALAKAISGNPQKDCHVEKSLLLGSARMLGLLEPGLGDWVKGPDLSVWADRLAALRVAAMASKDFAGVDAMKAALMAAGVEVRMCKAGVELGARAGFDAAKLEAL